MGREIERKKGEKGRKGERDIERDRER